MKSDAFVKLALELLGCSQKELAARLGVSPTQVSLWKKGSHISFDMREKLSVLTEIGDTDPELILWTGGVEAAKKWEALIEYLASIASQSAETGYNTEPLTENIHLLSWSTFKTLIEMGVEIPNNFPEELSFDYETLEDDSEIFEKNLHSSLILKIYTSFNDIYGYYAAYISELLLDEDMMAQLGFIAEDIEASLIELAASKIKTDDNSAKHFSQFKRKTTAKFETWINHVKTAAFKTRTPLRAEITDIIYKTPDEVGHQAETESFGINKRNLHPDIYINELLVGMRIIHQVLPAILKKLEIKDDFELNTSELRLE